MSFGRNPHVAKAEAAALKASCAKDALAREAAYREAAHLWERAAERETDAKRKQQYVDNAASARASADQPAAEDPSAEPDPQLVPLPAGARAAKALN